MPDNHYFVDEAGDLTLFGRRGKDLLGTEGVSRCFMVGMALAPDPDQLHRDLEGLRRDLLADAYLKPIPSMQPAQKKTAQLFHAKNDCVEVRMAVFKLLARCEIEVQVAIRRKSVLAQEARLAKAWGRPWHPNSVYDDLVKQLFARSLHKTASVICFARRGKSPRERALAEATNRAQQSFAWQFHLVSPHPVQIIPAVPSEVAGLQAVDYFLWAIQRLYERGEERYFEYLRPCYRLIMDLDDKRNKPDGEWYSDANPLRKERLLPVTG